MKLIQATMADLDQLERLVAKYHQFELIGTTAVGRIDALAPLLEPDSSFGKIYFAVQA